MNDDEVRSRGREAAETLQEMVPKIEIDRAVQEVRAEIEETATELRQEWQLNIDRGALEAAKVAGEKAKEHSEEAVKRSHRRWMTLIVVHAVTGAFIAGIIVAAAMQWAYAQENRTRIERLERAFDALDIMRSP